MKIDKNNSYIVKRKNGVCWQIFYEKSLGISYQVLKQNKWSEKNTIYKNGTENFSVVLLNNDNIYIFCQDISGSIILLIYDGAEWKQHVLLNRKNSNMDSVYFYATIFKNDFHLFYNICEKSANRDILVHQVAYKGEKWSSPKLIDNIKPLEDVPFIIRTDGKDNMYILYQTNKSGFNLGYKRFSSEGYIWSEFHTIDKSDLGYLDYSFMIANNMVHLLYTKKEKYYNQLIYCTKKNDWKVPVLISEDDKMSSCSLFVLDEHVWVTWIAGDKLYSSYSVDFGESFSKPVMHEELESTMLNKVIYQSNVEKEKNNLEVNEVYMDSENEVRILVIPQILPSIVNLDTTINEEKNLLDVTNDSNLELFKMQFNKLYEKIYSIQKQLREKDYQLAQVNYTLEHKNSEITNLEYNNRLFVERIDLLSKENESLKEINKALQQKLVSYENHITSLENRILDKQSEINNLQKRKNDMEGEVTLMQNQIKTLQDNIEVTKKQLEQKNNILQEQKNIILLEQRNKNFISDEQKNNSKVNSDETTSTSKNKTSILKQFFGFGDNRN